MGTWSLHLLENKEPHFPSTVNFKFLVELRSKNDKVSALQDELDTHQFLKLGCCIVIITDSI